MTQVILKNCDPIGPVRVEARPSNPGLPYKSLPIAEGFPRWIDFEEKVEIDIGAWTELLFRRSCDGRNNKQTEHNLSEVFRVGNPRKHEKIHGFIWERPRVIGISDSFLEELPDEPPVPTPRDL